MSVAKVFTREAITLIQAMHAAGASHAVMAAAIGCKSVGSLRARASQLGFFREQQPAKAEAA